MHKGRVEAFSDGVIAILITIMVLELKVPHGEDFAALLPVLPVLASYVLSFIFVGIYWNNHHHMLQLAQQVTGRTLWANLFLLFWLSLVPFTTEWMGESHLAQAPTALYAFVLLMCGVAYYVLQQTIIRGEGPGSALAKAVGQDKKGLLSVVLNLAAVPMAFVQPSLAVGLLLSVALIWLVPDSRIEKKIEHHAAKGGG